MFLVAVFWSVSLYSSGTGRLAAPFPLAFAGDSSRRTAILGSPFESFLSLVQSVRGAIARDGQGDGNVLIVDAHSAEDNAFLLGLAPPLYQELGHLEPGHTRCGSARVAEVVRAPPSRLDPNRSSLSLTFLVPPPKRNTRDNLTPGPTITRERSTLPTEFTVVS